ncbi:XRE family transcriptional regulator [Halobacillus shinanisalinarum]|uniref:XRE family transcriptional regulator n=1 Tax=Halobacillus shinanisalinarum TaxID=2932258 RepID=A0ABY4H660_9BACI|nr:XRE family transcriptional regulator [Halobacillus shinanisalinarum]UOQ95580.1 XRE family transcriptional regulator [Halobacillus shinanisalinarum]
MNDEKKLSQQVGSTLRKVRNNKGLSLQELADLSNVSKLTLGNIERGEANPSLSVIWKIANALSIPISSLLNESNEIVISRNHSGNKVLSHNEACLLEPMFDEKVYGPIEIHRAFLKASSEYSPGPHQQGVIEYVTVMEGCTTVTIEETSYELNTYDSIKFKADVKHSYLNKGTEEAVLHFVMTYTN